MEKKKIVFLYTEIATYFLACVNTLLQKHPVEVHVIRYKTNKEAPFRFNFPAGLKIYERNEYSNNQLYELVSNISPSLIICSGWVDKGYLNICKKNNAISVLTLDNHWKGTLKQWILRFISPFYLKRRFSFCWVPGALQLEYAMKLGFKKKFILTGFYSCDFEYFQKQFFLTREKKCSNFPRRFIYVGRYVDAKGIQKLWKAFTELQEEEPNEWELWCLGTGPIQPVEHPKIRHFGFIQPGDLHHYIEATGVFVLPSLFEPWGVVVHEFAAAGFPIICSNEVGAHATFVENNINGYIYSSFETAGLRKAMKMMMTQTNERLNEMAKASQEKSKMITPALWTNQIISLL